MGLEPGVQGECYLVPYRDNKRNVVECQLIVGYQGIVKLFWQHPLAAGVTAEWVGANDTFRFSKGLNPILEHEQARSGERGDPVYYYAIVRAKGREPLWDVFTPEEIKKLRRGKVGSSGDIADPMHWMERKTALKQVLKLAPKSTRLDMALRSDETSGTELSQSMDIAALTEAPDYIEGEFAETTDGPEPDSQAISPPQDVVLVTRADLAKLKNIRAQEKYDDDAAWLKYLETAIGHPVDGRQGSDRRRGPRHHRRVPG
jgi:recombination protein RecT